MYLELLPKGYTEIDLALPYKPSKTVYDDERD
jgi:hypothetical protein